MQEKTLELVNRYLEAEEQTEKLVKLPGDTYSKIAVYMQNLRRSSNANGEDPTSRLIRKQVSLLQGMVNQLLQVRLEKAAALANGNDLLPEEKYVFSLYREFQRLRERFTKAVINGQPSFFTMAYKNEMGKKVTVRFLKPLGEIIGFDLRRYGPFKTHDIAVVPSGNAEVLVANGEAAIVDSSRPI